MKTESLIPNSPDDIHEGIHLLREARIQDAIAVFENTIRIHPNTEDAIGGKALAFLMLEKNIRC